MSVHPTQLRTNSTSANDLIGYPCYSTSECWQIPVQVQDPGVEAYNDYGTYLGGNPANTRTQIEELERLILTINKEWMQKLLPNRELYTRCSSMSARTLLWKGMNTLKTWYLGKVERSFEEVFSFMHVAFAVASTLHRNDESYCWDAFFQDTLCLQHALIDNEERLLFLEVMSRYWWREGQQSTHISMLMSVDCHSSWTPNHVPTAKRPYRLLSAICFWGRREEYTSSEKLFPLSYILFFSGHIDIFPF